MFGLVNLSCKSGCLETSFFPERMNYYGKFGLLSFHHFASTADYFLQMTTPNLVAIQATDKIDFGYLVMMKYYLDSFGQGLHCGCCIVYQPLLAFDYSKPLDCPTHVVSGLELNYNSRVVWN